MRLIPPHPLTNFEIQRHYQNKLILKGVYSRNNFANTLKDGVNIINLDEDKSIGIHWIALYVNDHNMTYFDSFGVE